MLKAYGVGDEKATVLAATFTWLLKGNLGYTLGGTPTPDMSFTFFSPYRWSWDGWKDNVYLAQRVGNCI
jgi:hypothetical protein